MTLLFQCCHPVTFSPFPVSTLRSLSLSPSLSPEKRAGKIKNPAKQEIFVVWGRESAYSSYRSLRAAGREENRREQKRRRRRRRRRSAPSGPRVSLRFRPPSVIDTVKYLLVRKEEGEKGKDEGEGEDKQRVAEC